MKNIVQRIAMKAVIVRDGKILIIREAKTYVDGTQIGRWHMPGGRLEAGEHFEDGLKHEVREETGLDIEVEYPIYCGEWSPTIKGVQHQIIALFQVCSALSSNVILSSEHDKYEWINPQNHSSYDIMDPEDKVIERYVEWVSKKRKNL